jgi:dipeptidyl aminopeptidase/acylaminoacyl peptidase
MFLARGYDVLLPDSRGHGRSGGELVTFGVREKYDVLDWVRWLRSEGCTQIYALGESLGASVLIQTVAVDPVFRAIVAESPYLDLQAIAEYRVREHLHFPKWVSGVAARVVVGGGMVYANVRYGLDLTEASPLSAMAKSKTPILLIHGTNDVETPFTHSKRLAEASGSAVLWLVPNATHTSASSAAPNEFQERVLEWFAQH